MIPPNPHNEFYLQTKAVKSGHLIDIEGKEHYQEQMDLPLVEGMDEEQVEALQQRMEQSGAGLQL